MSQSVVLANESQDAYAELLADYLSRFSPQGSAELDLVHEIASTRWRLRRIVRMDSAIFDRQMEQSLETDPTSAEAAAFEALAANSKPLAMLGRYENRLRRNYEKALVELRALQTARKSAEEEKEQNEPKPKARQAAATTASRVISPLPSSSPMSVSEEHAASPSTRSNR